MLRAKVEQEREARRLAEKQLKAVLDRVGVSPRNKKRMWNKNDHGAQLPSHQNPNPNP